MIRSPCTLARTRTITRTRTHNCTRTHPRTRARTHANAPAHIRAGAGAGDWECPICTCVNPEVYLVCDACACDRPEAQASSTTAVNRAAARMQTPAAPAGQPAAAPLPPSVSALTGAVKRGLQPAVVSGGRLDRQAPAVPSGLRKAVEVEPPRDWRSTEEALEFLGESIPNYRIESDMESDESET